MHISTMIILSDCLISFCTIQQLVRLIMTLHPNLGTILLLQKLQLLEVWLSSKVTSINLDVLVSFVVKSKILKISLVSLFVYGDIHGFGIARSAEPNLNPKAATAKFKLCQISKTRKNHFKKNTSEV